MDFLRTNVTDELITYIIRVTRIGELVTEARCKEYYVDYTISSQRVSVDSYCNVVHSSPIPSTLVMEAVSSSETSVLTRATRRHIL
jgi:hypothetical protein